MTEDEAKTKWCPMARVVVGTISESMAACNRSIQGMPPDLEAQTRCIASACMMWDPFVAYDDAIPAYIATEPPSGDCGLKVVR